MRKYHSRLLIQNKKGLYFDTVDESDHINKGIKIKILKDLSLHAREFSLKNDKTSQASDNPDMHSTREDFTPFFSFPPDVTSIDTIRSNDHDDISAE